MSVADNTAVVGRLIVAGYGTEIKERKRIINEEERRDEKVGNAGIHTK
jgi:hypothetical protein